MGTSNAPLQAEFKRRCREGLDMSRERIVSFVAMQIDR